MNAGLDLGIIDDITGGKLGVHDVPCALCSATRTLLNRRKRILRVWRLNPGFATYHCVHCLVRGHVRDHAGKLDPVALERARTDASERDRVAKRKQIAKAQRLHSHSLPIAGTIGEDYFREVRAYRGPLSPTIRFLPARGQYGPAVIVPYGIPEEPEPGILVIARTMITAGHITRLKPDGSAKVGVATIASPGGMPIILAPPNDSLGLAICEGIEDALSVYQATGLGAWAAGGAGFMPKIAAAVPNYIETVTIYTHADEAGQRGARELAEALVARHVKVRNRGQAVKRQPDVNETLQSEGEAAVRARHDHASDYEGSKEKANDSAQEQTPGEGVTIEDFRAYLPQHNYIFTPTRETWPAASVNARVPPMPVLDANGRPALDDKGKHKLIPASAWLDRYRSVEQMTWSPGMPMLIRDHLVREGGLVPRKEVVTLNLYQPPDIVLGDAAKAGPWLDHVRRLYPKEADHIIMWSAHRRQKPQEKINHAIVLIGSQGIGKDTLLEPVKRAVGPWNFIEVSPQQMQGRFNGFAKSVILRVSEARDLGDIDRFQFYDHTKVYTASPPDVLRVDEKNLREHSVLNCCGVIITSNHKQDGIYLPAEDRRHFVAYSELTKDHFPKNYWKNLYGFYAEGGDRHVAAYLAERDISSFDPKAPPPKTPAFWDIVDANRAPEDAELADVLDSMGNPDATTLARIASEASSEFKAWITDRKNRRVIPHRLDKAGYSPVRNEAAISDGMWKINGTRQVVYAKKTLPLRDRLAAVNGFVGQSSR